jgi:hypothetical protein
MEFPRPRDIAKAIGFAAALGASSAKAEKPLKGSAAAESVTFAAKIKKEKAPLDLVSDMVTFDAKSVEEHNKIVEDNPNGLGKKPTDIISGVKYKIPLVQIENARDIALKLAVDPNAKSEKTAGFVGLEVDL